MRFFIDECLSRELARRLNVQGYDAVHPIDVGCRGDPDHVVLSRCIEEDRIIATQNDRDFRRLVAGTDLHPGLILLPGEAKEPSWQLLARALAYLEAKDDCRSFMVNRVIELGLDASLHIFELP